MTAQMPGLPERHEQIALAQLLASLCPPGSNEAEVSDDELNLWMTDWQTFYRHKLIYELWLMGEVALCTKGGKLAFRTPTDTDRAVRAELEQKIGTLEDQ